MPRLRWKSVQGIYVFENYFVAGLGISITTPVRGVGVSAKAAFR